MNRGISLLLAYLGFAWFIAGGGALLPAFEARSDASAGTDFAVELAIERSKPLLEAAQAQLDALEEVDETPEEAIATLKDEIARIAKERDNEIAQIKAASSDEGGGIMEVAGPLLSMLLGMALMVVGLMTLGRSRDFDDEDPAPKKRRKRRRPDADEEPAEAV